MIYKFIGGFQRIIACHQRKIWWTYNSLKSIPTFMHTNFIYK